MSNEIGLQNGVIGMTDMPPGTRTDDEQRE